MSGNTILITGGTSGIGHALAAQLLARGNKVLITSRTQARLIAARESLPGVQTFVCDQADPAAIARLHEEIARAAPDLNVLINNAGIGLKLNLNDTSRPLAALGGEIATNLTGPIQLVQQFLPLLKRQKSALIVNVTSGLAFVPFPMKPIYCATKAAMHSYTQSLRVQLTKSTVKVVELAPPAVMTDFNKGQEDMNAGPRMDADVFARAAIRGLETGRDEVLPGFSHIARLLGRIAPHLTLRRSDAEDMGSVG